MLLAVAPLRDHRSEPVCVCIVRVLHVHCIVCALHCVCIACALHCMCIVRALIVHCMYVVCALCVQSVCIACALRCARMRLHYISLYPSISIFLSLVSACRLLCSLVLLVALCAHSAVKRNIMHITLCSFLSISCAVTHSGVGHLAHHDFGVVAEVKK